MASRRTKTIDEIGDLAEMFKVTEAFGISCSGLTTLDEMKAKVKEELNPSKDKPSWTAGQTYEILSEAKKSDTKKRERLLELFIKTEKFMDQLGADFTETLQKGLGDFKTTLKKNIDDIKPRGQYVVLVAGETSAGKSSVINLILGEDLLPYALLSTTSTICELKYGEKPKIGVHFKQTGSETREPMFQELVTDGRETYMQQIEKFVSLKSGREKVPYTKIELFFPHPLFKEGVMIVDSPGIGESDVMSEFVLNYLPRAFCFMYVINSYNAGGIQSDRLEKLLTYAQNLKENAEVDLALFTGCTLFVANKWDLIEKEEREEVKKAQIEKLSKKLPNLKPKSQIVHLSCKTAQLAQAYGVITGDFDDLIAGISNLVVSSMKNNLEKYCRKLEDLLAHVSRQIRILLKSTEMTHQETEERIKRVMSRMEELKSSQERRFGELSEHQSQTIQNIIAKLAAHFKSAETMKKFCDWSTDEVPAASKTWKETKDEALKYISERTHQFVQQWEDDEHEFAKAQLSLIQYCIDKYDVMADEIYKVEEQAFRDESEADVSQDEEVTQNKSQKSTAPTWLRQGLASVVVSSPRVFSEFAAKLRRKIQHKTKLESYNDDPCSYMSRRSRKCLKLVATEERLLPFINTQLEDAVQFLKQIKEKIPQLREGDERLYKQLLEDERSNTERKEVYEPLKIQIKLLQHSLTVYNLNEIRKSDFTDEELKCDEKWQSIITDGSFSTLYRGVLHRKGQPAVEVALKRYRDPLTTNNVWHFVDEERALRELSHPNIVKFYGTNLQHGRNGTTVIIILELCSCSLSYHVMSHPEEAPARFPKEAVMKKVLGWALNILDALQYIHSKRFVHRDLILDNILLAPDGLVKVADVGVTKHENAVSGAICSTSIYLAPEVFEYRVYNSKADMYSFGYVLWELWYGETAFRTAIDSRTEYQVLEDVVKHDLRPTHIEGTQHPWGDWQYVMALCWNKDPKLRLTARRGWKQLQNFDVSLPPPPPTEPSSLSPPPPPPTEPSSLSPPPPPPTEPSSLSPPPPRPPKSSLLRRGPPTKPKPNPKKPEGTSVSYYRETEDGNVHFE